MTTRVCVKRAGVVERGAVARAFTPALRAEFANDYPEGRSAASRLFEFRRAGRDSSSPGWT